MPISAFNTLKTLNDDDFSLGHTKKKQWEKVIYIYIYIYIKMVVVGPKKE